MLAKNPDERFADMGELQAALKGSGGSMFVVRGTAPASSDAAKSQPSISPPSVSTSNPKLPKLRDTTFSTGVGERVDDEVPRAEEREGEGGGGLLRRRRARGGGRFHLPRRREGRNPARAGGDAGRARAQSGCRRWRRPAPVAPAKPAAPKTVTVHVESDPPGASVVDEASGGKLGVTPLVLTRSKGGALKLRLEKDGYTPNAHALSLDDDQTIELTLEHKQVKPAHVHKAHPPAAAGESEPAKL